MANAGKVLGAATIIAFFTIPVFRSGGRTHLTGFQWLVNHTIFGPPVEYVPAESIARELYGVKLVKVTTWQVKELTNRQINEESARRLAITKKLC